MLLCGRLRFEFKSLSGVVGWCKALYTGILEAAVDITLYDSYFVEITERLVRRRKKFASARDNYED